MLSAKLLHKLSIEANQSSPEAVRGFLMECLVPLLAKEFLLARKVSANFGSQKPTSEPLSMEHGRRADHTHVK
jgi:hypothetical protein